ncbi:MAG: hypothetical protein AB1921_12150, partial [Thermodesulfobacteriota bacterium]
MKKFSPLHVAAILGLALLFSASSASAANSLAITSPVNGATVTGDAVNVTAAVGGAASLQSFSALLNGRAFSGFRLEGNNLVATLRPADGLVTGAAAPGEQNTLVLSAVFLVPATTGGRRARPAYLTTVTSRTTFYSLELPPLGPSFDITGSVSGTVLVAVVGNEIVASYDTAG